MSTILLVHSNSQRGSRNYKLVQLFSLPNSRHFSNGKKRRTIRERREKRRNVAPKLVNLESVCGCGCGESGCSRGPRWRARKTERWQRRAHPRRRSAIAILAAPDSQRGTSETEIGCVPVSFRATSMLARHFAALTTTTSSLKHMKRTSCSRVIVVSYSVENLVVLG